MCGWTERTAYHTRIRYKMNDVAINETTRNPQCNAMNWNEKETTRTCLENEIATNEEKKKNELQSWNNNLMRERASNGDYADNTKWSYNNWLAMQCDAMSNSRPKPTCRSKYFYSNNLDFFNMHIPGHSIHKLNAVCIKIQRIEQW